MLINFLSTWITAVRRTELVILVALFLVAGGTWLFIKLADEVVEGETLALDEQILLALRNPADRADPLGPIWLEESVRDVTALGGGIFLAILTGSVVGYLVFQRRYRLAFFLIVAIFGGALLSIPLKALFERPRPDLAPHGMRVVDTSFPSGHSMAAAATYLTLGMTLAQVQTRRRLKLYFLTLALLLTLLVGLSRIYLGVHWPTDVLAGWTAGSIWTLLCWLGARWVQQRQKGQADTLAE